jgi:hypothetical protein
MRFFYKRLLFTVNMYKIKINKISFSDSCNCPSVKLLLVLKMAVAIGHFSCSANLRKSISTINISK